MAVGINSIMIIDYGQQIKTKLKFNLVTFKKPIVTEF